MGVPGKVSTIRAIMFAVARSTGHVGWGSVCRRRPSDTTGGKKARPQAVRNALAVTWEAISAISTAFTAVVITVTALLGVYQLGQLRAQRRDAAAIELMHSLQDTTFARAFRLIFLQHDTTSAIDVVAGGPEVEEAAMILAFRFETIGLMVYRGTISFRLVDDLVGGATIGIWNRLSGWVIATRTERGWPMYCEWFQWLAERFVAHGRLDRPPAHERVLDWKPSRDA